jgi:hypothetical protein
MFKSVQSSGRVIVCRFLVVYCPCLYMSAMPLDQIRGYNILFQWSDRELPLLLFLCAFHL